MAWAVDVVAGTGNVARLGVTSGGVLEEEGIDDLAKYRIVLHLLEHPSLIADADSYATTLGFHSTSRTAALLDEMAASGLLTRHTDPDGRALYGLSPDSERRRRLAENCGARLGSPEYGLLLRRLAQRSVARARGRGKRRAQVCWL